MIRPCFAAEIPQARSCNTFYDRLDELRLEYEDLQSECQALRAQLEVAQERGVLTDREIELSFNSPGKKQGWYSGSSTPSQSVDKGCKQSSREDSVPSEKQHIWQSQVSAEGVPDTSSVRFEQQRWPSQVAVTSSVPGEKQNWHSQLSAEDVPGPSSEPSEKQRLHARISAQEPLVFASEDDDGVARFSVAAHDTEVNDMASPLRESMQSVPEDSATYGTQSKTSTGIGEGNGETPPISYAASAGPVLEAADSLYHKMPSNRMTESAQKARARVLHGRSGTGLGRASVLSVATSSSWLSSDIRSGGRGSGASSGSHPPKPDNARNALSSLVGNPRKTSRQASAEWMTNKFTIMPRWYDPARKNIAHDKRLHSARRIGTQQRSFSVLRKSGICLQTQGMDDWSQLCRVDDYETAAIAESSSLGGCIISPVSKKRMIWDFFAVTFLLWEFWVTLFRFFYMSEESPPAVITYLAHISTGFWSMDIVLNFFTGFVVKDLIVRDFWRSIWHYFKSWFFVDLIATIPYDLIMSSISGDWMSTVRVAKVTKVMKTLRFLKMMRAVRIVYSFSQAEGYNTLLSNSKRFVKPIQLLIVICFLAHLDGCIWSLEHPEWEATTDLSDALHRYFESFWWAFQLLVTTGTPGAQTQQENSRLWLIEMLVVLQRLALILFGGVWLTCAAGYWVSETSRWSAMQVASGQYLRRHSVSAATQVQVLYSMHETVKVKRLQRHFQEFMAQNLPNSLRRTVCAELFGPKLQSLGLLAHVGFWNDDLLPELAQLVTEEVVASKTYLFKEGELANNAYHIFEGQLVIIASGVDNSIDFSKGMWVGEKALINPLLRRSGTAITAVTSTLIAVPGEGFHELLANFALMERFKVFVSNELWRGLCGRCGVFGDHFTHQCPLATNPEKVPDAPTKHSTASSTLYKYAKKGGGAVIRSFSGGFSKDPGEEIPVASELKNFLLVQKLTWLTKYLKELDIYDLDALAKVDITVLLATLESDGRQLTSHEQLRISAPVIRKFIIALQDQAHSVLSKAGAVTSDEHYVFLSHFKREAGTEATLMRSELETMMKDDPGCPAARFLTPIFLDSEDLTNLKDLQLRVKQTHNLVLLLTAGVLTRPWVLVELVTAIRDGVHVVPVVLHKGVDEFLFPDEKFYASVLDGTLLDQSGEQVLQECSVSMRDVEDVLRQVFQKIAVTYSPHRAQNIRHAELQALCRQLVIKKF